MQVHEVHLTKKWVTDTLMFIQHMEEHLRREDGQHKDIKYSSPI